MKFAVVIGALAALAFAQSPCIGKTEEACNIAPSQGLYCVMVGGSCQADPCQSISNSSACLANPECMPVPWNNGATCFSYSTICSVLPVESCRQLSVCASRGSYCSIIKPPEPGESGVSCLKFPAWSIALMIIWVCIMAILGFIIFLIVSKGKQNQIKSVEREDVVVESVQIRDNFNLGGTAQPLMA